MHTRRTLHFPERLPSPAEASSGFQIPQDYPLTGSKNSATKLRVMYSTSLFQMKPLLLNTYRFPQIGGVRDSLVEKKKSLIKGGLGYSNINQISA